MKGGAGLSEVGGCIASTVPFSVAGGTIRRFDFGMIGEPHAEQLSINRSLYGQSVSLARTYSSTWPAGLLAASGTARGGWAGMRVRPHARVNPLGSPGLLELPCIAVPPIGEAVSCKGVP
jgi:hypothetical protein